MKAITIKEPWASLIVFGHKRVENRTWRTLHRGPLAIHSSARVCSERSQESAGDVPSRRQTAEYLNRLLRDAGAVGGDAEIRALAVNLARL